ncbi:hypothetical protein ANN_26967 [Periplaneta americana]|uniref:Uncharacterized protein n=1 Tax=Periplaneta americana TaxID=6978 RepID=A0ABQ8RWU8_PERAM|nr:hypothetical protein ANN_26967 [Periplaneta americana]
MAEVCYSETNFSNRYSRWLDHNITLPIEKTSCVSTPKKHTDIPSTSGKLGRSRPTKVFGELSERSKRRKAKETRENMCSEELSYATAMNLRSEGDEVAAKLLKEVTTTTPSRGKRIRDSLRKEEKEITRFTNEEALSLIIDSNLSGHSQYKQIWNQKEKSDESLFLTSLVPLRLVDAESRDVAWKNPRPSSTRFCKSIQLQWVHETTEIAKAERVYVENQIQNLQPFTLGELTEEAIESLNITVRRFRQDHTRKTSRITTNSDLFHRLFLASDPLISNLRELPKKERTQLSLQVLQLLSTSEGPNSEGSGDSDSED